MGKVSKYIELAALAACIIFIGACGNLSNSQSDLGSNGDNGDDGGTTLTNEYSSPKELGVGDLMYINFDEDTDEANVSFSGVDSAAKFILIVGSASTSGVSTSISLSSNLSSIIEEDKSAYIPKESDYEPSEILSAWLRAAEFDLAATETPPAARSNFKAMQLEPNVALGDIEEFRVLSSLVSTTDYETVDGEVRCIGDNVVFYVDTAISADILSDAEVTTLCENFDQEAEDEQEIFGEVSDVNGDRKISVLITYKVNDLGNLYGGIITGFFWGGDLYAQTQSNPCSNYREIVYTMAPDPDGIHGVAVSNDFALGNLLPAVLPHELQHAISYNQHVFVNGGPPEENWLNEAASHFAEDWIGEGMENYSRYEMPLSSPSYSGVVVAGQPDLYERGASYLFLRYLYEQAASGDTFITNLLNTSSTGVDNLEQAFNGSTGFSKFHEFFARWTVAIALTDEGVTRDARYVYQPRTRNSETGNWEGACLKCDADDGRGTVLTGVSKTTYTGDETVSIAASAAKYYDVTSVPSRIALSGSTGGDNFGVLIRTE